MSPLYLARSKDIAARMLGDEMIIMSARDSTLFSLNEVGSVIWQAADGATPLDEIVERKICPEFDVEPEEALKDAEEFVRELAGHGILVISESPLGEARIKKQEARSKKEEGRSEM
jgi:GGDEF domain-containing protein